MSDPPLTDRAAVELLPIKPIPAGRMLDAFQRQFAPSGDPSLEIAMAGVAGSDAMRIPESYEEALVRATHAAREGSRRAGDDGGTELPPSPDLPLCSHPSPSRDGFGSICAWWHQSASRAAWGTFRGSPCRS